MATRAVEINRAPVLTLWAAVVAERMGFDWDEAVSRGRAVAYGLACPPLPRRARGEGLADPIGQSLLKKKTA